MIVRSMMTVSPGSRRSHSCLRQKKAQPETLAAAFTTPSHTAALLAVLLAVACSGPGSYEEFVRAEDATGGVYEFALPASICDLSFYTAPLDEPLQLEITWKAVEPNQLNINDMPETPLQPELSRRFCETADNQEIMLHALHRETVWFPAGQNKALYRSGVRLAGAVVLRVRPVNPPEDFRGLGIIIKRNDGTR